MNDFTDEALRENQQDSEELTEETNAVKRNPEDEEKLALIDFRKVWFPRIIYGLVGSITVIFVMVFALMILRMFCGKEVPWQEVVALIGTGLGGVFAMTQILLKYLFPSK